MKLLSVDWDFFSPVGTDPKQWALYDWGHRDSGDLFLNAMWYHRAAGFVINDLPLPGTSGAEVGFWNRFKFRESTKLFYSESHQHIYNPSVYDLMRDGGSILNFDAHHDAGYRGENKKAYIEKAKVTCEDWAFAYNLHSVKTKLLYPPWKTDAMEQETKPAYRLSRKFDDGAVIQGPFDHIFVCRSGGWTPPWIDDKFDKLIAECPAAYKINLDGVKNRNFDQARLASEVETSIKVRESLQAVGAIS